MQDKIKKIYEANIKLLSYIDKAVIRFREGRYDLALSLIAETGDGINLVCDAVLGDRDYFAGISVDTVTTMLKSILEAKQKKDYVLLADLYEMQLSAFIGDVQEHILKAEDLSVYDDETYAAHIGQLQKKLDDGIRYAMSELLSDDDYERLKVNRNAELEEPLAPEKLLERGYGVEFTACGLMTLKAPLTEGEGIYLHSNGNVAKEGFLLAHTWYDSRIETYLVYGFGMGYHVRELAKLAPSASIIVFEPDINVLKLYAAFGDSTILMDRNIYPVYDPDGSFCAQCIKKDSPARKVCVHYPSFRCSAAHSEVRSLVPWSDRVENC